MNGFDFVEWRGKTHEIRGPIIKRDKSDRLSALFGKQAESREHSKRTQQRSCRRKRKDKQNNRQTATDRQ